MKNIEQSLSSIAAWMIVALVAATCAFAQNRKPQTTHSATPSSPAANSAGNTTSSTIPLPVLGGGTPNFVPLWTGRQIIGNSLLSQTPTGLNVAGAISATSFTGDGSALVNINALSLQGLSSAAFAQVRSPNTFTGDQTISGNLNVTGTFNSALGLQGSLSDSLGEEGANVIGGFQGDAAFPGNTVSPGVIGATIAGGGGAISTSSLPAKPQRKARLHPASYSVVQGSNVVQAGWGTIGGGAQNCANGLYATVAGGVQNCATVMGAFVGGGAGNTASGDPSTGGYSLVAGGLENTSSGTYSTIGGGQSSTASAVGATIAGGEGNKALGGDATIAGGSANSATAVAATVPGGAFNTAAGRYSFAAGLFATANFDGSFVWSDSGQLSGAPTLADTAANQFVARASGGFIFYSASDLSAGVTLPSGSGSWSSLSDRNAKDNFSEVEGTSVLARLAAVRISTWNYKAQPASIRHIGPTAQDFRAAFGLGEDDHHISSIDAQGVALAGVQELYKLSQEKDTKIAALTDQLTEKSRQLEALERRLSRLEKLAEQSQPDSVPSATE